MVKAKKAKAAKSKATKKAKAAKSKATKKAKSATATNGWVAIVTPGTASTAGIDAFNDELKNTFGFTPNTSAVFSVADNLPTTLDAQVQAAVRSAPKVIIAAGSMAASKVQDKAPASATPPIAIIQAAGGEIPANKQANLTGFTIDALKIAKDHVESLLTAGSSLIAVVYDSTNPPSLNTWNTLSTVYRNLLPVDKADPTTLTASDLKDSAGHSANGVVLISNAVYYKHAQDIVGVLDGLTPMPTIYYPEREFKGKHTKKTTVHVHGHNIPLTYRLAAWYTASILNGDWAPTSLPDFKNAITDQN
jgi:hypothetical protein